MSETNDKPKCEECWFWQRLGPDESRGYCHRNPPAALGRHVTEPAETSKVWWCGEHKPLPEGSTAAVHTKGSAKPVPAYRR